MNPEMLSRNANQAKNVSLWISWQVLIVRADMGCRWLVRLGDGREVLVRAERLETWAILG